MRDLLAVRWYNGPKYYEILDGIRHAKVSPKRTHALLQGQLIEIVRRCAGSRGETGSEWSWYIGRVDNSQSSLQPDISFVTHNRIGSLTRAQAEKPPIAPDIAIEIHSPRRQNRFS